ncbi:C40 family peptidase [Chakrabartyella piscis]|uniref:C40 family peptidase n=1 Tax=Chakrabartyella piscis TaxID=2918914 RepID=UPI002958BE02|nr:C40 family peptidase [Chakrabartyella piscis]
MKVALLKKAIATALTDERLRNGVLSFVVGAIICLLLPLLLLVSMVNTEANYSREVARIVFQQEEIPEDFPEEHVVYIEEMQAQFLILDEVIEEWIEGNAEENTEGLDELQIKSYFYVLYFGKENLEFADTFYQEFIGVFVENETDLEIQNELETLLNMEFTEDLANDQKELYLFIKYGYVATSNFNGIPSEAFDDETFAALMSEATKYIGMAYVWGGSYPSTGFDCSGFICWSYTQSGVYQLSRTTAQGIYNQCTSVAKEDLQPGDLVFFTDTYTSTTDVTHVGIYVGDNQMLHCGDPIGYESLSNSYWKQHFYGYGRLAMR